jgi:ribosomal protein L7/L12
MQENLVSQGIHSAGKAGINPVAVLPQERPEFGANSEALLAADKIKAIELYRSLSSVSMKEALDALNAM